jgi:hypothetical protein
MAGENYIKNPLALWEEHPKFILKVSNSTLP